MTRVHLIFRTRQETLCVPIPEALFVAVRKNAKRKGVPYRRYIRQVLEHAATTPKRSKAKAG